MKILKAKLSPLHPVFLLSDWRNARDAFRKISEATPARMLTGGGWDRCVRIWDDFDRIIEHMEKSANADISRTQ